MAELVYLLRHARCVVANDSGVMHLGAALGLDGIAMFGSTDEIATGPLGNRWITLTHNLECSPCLSRTCPKDRNQYECLTEIHSAEVISCLQDLLAG